MIIQQKSKINTSQVYSSGGDITSATSSVILYGKED